MMMSGESPQDATSLANSSTPTPGVTDGKSPTISSTFKSSTGTNLEAAIVDPEEKRLFDEVGKLRAAYRATRQSIFDVKTRAIGEEAARVLIEQIITGDWSPIEKMIGGRIIPSFTRNWLMSGLIMAGVGRWP